VDRSSFAEIEMQGKWSKNIHRAASCEHAARLQTPLSRSCSYSSIAAPAPLRLVSFSFYRTCRCRYQSPKRESCRRVWKKNRIWKTSGQC